MEQYASSTDVVLEVEHEYNGTALTLTGLEYEVLDASGAELLARTAVGSLDATSTEVTIDAAYNATTEKKDARQINFYLITAAGTYEKTVIYLVVNNPLQLTTMVDSFQTFAESKLTRVKLAEELTYFDELEDSLQAVALEASYDRLTKLKFLVGSTVYSDITELTATEFNALDSKFVAAIKKAQLVEANIIVENSPVRDKIRAGIISETIGESSMFFRQAGIPQGKYNGISDDAYEYIKLWLYRNPTHAQIWKLARG